LQAILRPSRPLLFSFFPRLLSFPLYRKPARDLEVIFFVLPFYRSFSKPTDDANKARTTTTGRKNDRKGFSEESVSEGEGERAQERDGARGLTALSGNNVLRITFNKTQQIKPRKPVERGSNGRTRKSGTPEESLQKRACAWNVRSLAR